MQNKVQPLPSSAVPAAERSEAERSETERSAAVGTAGADPSAIVRPDPEVVAKARCLKLIDTRRDATVGGCGVGAADWTATGGVRSVNAWQHWHALRVLRRGACMT